MVVFLKFPDGFLRCVSANSPTTSIEIKGAVTGTAGFPESFYLINNGKIIDEHDVIPDDSTVHIVPRLVGGKGGFGSMLRAIGAQIEKTTNREACRDLSGRRMRDVNNEKKLRDWVGKQAEREKEKEERRRQRMERRRAIPKHNFSDPLYEQQKSKALENLDEALQEGLKSAAGTSGESSQNRKRKAASTETDPSKKARDWLGMDIDPDALSETDSEDDSSSGSGASPGPAADDGSPGPSTKDGSPGPLTEDGSPGPSTEDGSSKPSAEDGSPGPLTEDGSPGPSAKDGSPGPLSEDGPSKPSAEDGSPGPSVENGQSSSSETSQETNKQNSSKPENQQQESSPSSSSNDTTGEIPTAKSVTESKCPDSQPDPAEPTAPTSDEPQSRGAADQDAGSKAVTDTVQAHGEVDLAAYSEASQLEDLGLEALKAALTSRGMKCGGSLTERAHRLYSVKGLSPDQIPPSLRTKGGKVKGKGKK